MKKKTIQRRVGRGGRDSGLTAVTTIQYDVESDLPALQSELYRQNRGLPETNSKFIDDVVRDAWRAIENADPPITTQQMDTLRNTDGERPIDVLGDRRGTPEGYAAQVLEIAPQLRASIRNQEFHFAVRKGMELVYCWHFMLYEQLAREFRVGERLLRRLVDDKKYSDSRIRYIVTRANELLPEAIRTHGRRCQRELARMLSAEGLGNGESIRRILRGHRSSLDLPKGM